ncbi:hypothetical protein NPIL_393861 [Nephila pilipes]|uniref:Uncharacterized protein n=1 Tax=Nephila pilipes TaxID=299642 RepID=A0A8X6QG87_NEPPI|nr:hypothetical protein NPIL_393861 [Nephila pilipes]
MHSRETCSTSLHFTHPSTDSTLQERLTGLSCLFPSTFGDSSFASLRMESREMPLGHQVGLPAATNELSANLSMRRKEN